MNGAPSSGVVEATDAPRRSRGRREEERRWWCWARASTADAAGLGATDGRSTRKPGTFEPRSSVLPAPLLNFGGLP